MIKKYKLQQQDETVKNLIETFFIFCIEILKIIPLKKKKLVMTYCFFLCYYFIYDPQSKT